MSGPDEYSTGDIDDFAETGNEVSTSLALVTVGTRGSALAVRQTALIVALLREQNPGTEFTIKTLQTKADSMTERPISAFGDKGVFVQVLERALLDGEIDVAVHSLKDVPAETETQGLRLGAFSGREDARDVLVSRSGKQLQQLDSGAVVGTSSLRRRVQVMQIRPDLRMADIRGNVDTRLDKLSGGEYDALLLAAAGLIRLDLAARITEYLPIEQVTPGAGQGILAVQTRSGDAIEQFVRRIDDPTSRSMALAERAIVRGLEADCHSPVGAYATCVGDRMCLRAMAAPEDGSVLHRLEQVGAARDGERLGDELGRRLLRLLRG